MDYDERFDDMADWIQEYEPEMERIDAETLRITFEPMDPNPDQLAGILAACLHCRKIIDVDMPGQSFATLDCTDDGELFLTVICK